MRRLIFVFVLHLTNIYADECLVPSLEHGEVRGSGDGLSWTGQFSCLPGYSLVGSKTLKCRGGQWSSTVPVCTSLGSCDPSDLPTVASGRADPYNPRQYRGSVYKYSCSRGYRRWGQGLVHCTGDSWDLSRLPVCYKTSCSQAGLGELLGGEMKRKAGGGLHFYHCTRPGSVLSGSPALVCTEHGWNDTVPHCTYGPIMAELSGPETVSQGETVTYSCSGRDSNPPSTISWNVLTHSGQSAMHLAKISEVANTRTEEGWTTSSSVEISVPRTDSIIGLHLYCTVSNPELEQEIVKEQAVAVHFGPSDLSISGPSVASPDQKISLGCVTSPSVPPAQVSWIVSESASPIISEETIHQTYDGSFSTKSSMWVTVPGGSHVEDIVVQCVATQQTLGQASLEAVHVIRVTDPTTERTRETTEMRIPDDITETREDLDYYEDESYYDEEYDSNQHNIYTDATVKDNNPVEESFDPRTESAVADLYHKYREEEEDAINHVLLVNKEQSEGTGSEEQSDGSGLEPVVVSSQDREEGEIVFSKSEPTDRSSYSSLKHDTVSMTEAPQKEKKIKKEENKTVPLKASRVMSSASNAGFSIVFLVLPILISQI